MQLSFGVRWARDATTEEQGYSSMGYRLAIASLGFLAAISCSRPTAPSKRVRLDVMVTSGAEGCSISLLSGATRYEVYGLPDSLATLGLHLSVEGTVTHRPSICMIGPQLYVISATRLP